MHVNKKRKWFIEIIRIVLIGIIVKTNIDINRQFPQAKKVEKNTGEDMQLEQDILIRVEKITFSEVKNYKKYITKGIRALGGNAKILVVDAKIKNISSVSTKISLYEFVLQNKVWSNGVNPELFLELNPENIDLECILDAKTEIRVKIPFVIYDFQVKDKQWKELKGSKFDLVLSVYPYRKVIHII